MNSAGKAFPCDNFLVCIDGNPGFHLRTNFTSELHLAASVVGPSAGDHFLAGICLAGADLGCDVFWLNDGFPEQRFYVTACVSFSLRVFVFDEWLYRSSDAAFTKICCRCGGSLPFRPRNYNHDMLRHFWHFALCSNQKVDPYTSHT